MASIDQPLLAASAVGQTAGRSQRPAGRLCVAHQASARAPGSGDGGRRVPPGIRGQCIPQRRSCRWRRRWWERRWSPGARAHSTSGWSESATPGCGGRPTARFPAGRLAPSEAAVFGGLLVLCGDGGLAHRGKPAGGRGRARDVRALRLRLHAAQNADDAQYGDRGRSRARCLR